MRLLLISGLSIARNNSFTAQLCVLARGLIGAGCSCAVVGKRARARTVADAAFPLKEWSAGVTVRDLPELSTRAIEPFRARSEADAVVLLGYPDQFPVLSNPGAALGKAPRFLWAQLSRPPTILPLDTVVVPLTGRTGHIAERSGIKRIAPPIPHAVDCSIFTPKPHEARLRARDRLRIPPTAPVIGYVAVNQLRKRFDRLIEAFRLIRRHRPDAHLLLKTDRLRSTAGFDIPRLVAGADLSDAVTIVAGARGEAEIAALYSCMDLYLHASEWEGFGIPAAEALASGVALATHAGQGPGEFTPFPELVFDSRLVTDGSGTELAMIDPSSAAERALGFFALPEEERRRMSETARRTACRRFALDVIVSRWIETVRDAAAEAP